MKKILLISGHKNIGDLTSEGLRSWRDVNALKRSTGAHGERDYQWEHIAPRIRELLRDKFQVTITDAIYDDGVYSQDWDMVIALHYDGGGDENRCMISPPNPDLKFINDNAQSISQEFCKLFKAVYPSLTETINRDNRITLGMTDYYAWDYVSYNSPSVIIEEFNHTSQRGNELKQSPEQVAKAISVVILEYFGLNDPCIELRAELDKVNKELDDMRDSRNTWRTDYKELENKLETERIEHTTAIKEKDKIIEQYNKQVAEMTVTVNDKNKTINTLKEDNKHLTEQLVASELQLNDCETTNKVVIDSLNVNIETLNKKVDKLRFRIKLLEQEITNVLLRVSRWKLFVSIFRKRQRE